MNEFASAVSLLIIVGWLAAELSRGVRGRLRRRRVESAREREPSLGDCVPPESGR